jgi:hypothetical protein
MKLERRKRIFMNNTFQICPIFKDKSVSLMHLAKDERYTVSIEEKRGLEMKLI